MERSARCALFALALGLAPILVTDQGLGRAAAEKRSWQQQACIFDHHTLRTAPGKCRPHAITYPPGVRGRVRRAIYDSTLIFGVPYSILLRIARCESGLNPRARNGEHFGLFQFVPATFYRGAQEMRLQTGLQARNYWKPWDAATVAGFLFAVGQAPSWACENASRSAESSVLGL